MLLALSIAALAAVCLVVGFILGERSARGYLGASRQVAEHTGWVIEQIGKWTPTVEEMDVLSKRLTVQTQAINLLATQISSVTEELFTVLGINKDAAAERQRARGIDPRAEQVGERPAV